MAGAPGRAWRELASDEHMVQCGIHAPTRRHNTPLAASYAAQLISGMAWLPCRTPPAALPSAACCCTPFLPGRPPASAASQCSSAGIAVGSHSGADTGRGPRLPPGAPRRQNLVTASRFCTRRAAACTGWDRKRGEQSHAQCRACIAMGRFWETFRNRHRSSGHRLPPKQPHARSLQLLRSPAVPAPAHTCSRSISGCSPGVWASSEVALSGSSGSRQLLPSLPSMASANGLASGTVGEVGRRADTWK